MKNNIIEVKNIQIGVTNFKVFESEHFRKQVGLLTFTPSVSEWREKSTFFML